jgi:hypothetical protein
MHSDEWFVRKDVEVGCALSLLSTLCQRDVTSVLVLENESQRLHQIAFTYALYEASEITCFGTGCIEADVGTITLGDREAWSISVSMKRAIAKKVVTGFSFDFYTYALNDYWDLLFCVVMNSGRPFTIP